MFTYTSLSPEGGQSKAALMEFDGVRILADPGWDGISDISYLDRILPTVDIIILSHPTTNFIGAYAYLAFRDLKIPVYATLPTTNLGRVATLDLYRSVGLIGPLKGTEFELRDVEEAFDKIITVKHSQTIDLRGKYDGLSLTAINAGHTLGGTIWAINKNPEKVIYAPQWNHSKDSFLNGADLLQNSTLMRPSVIITSSAIGSVLPHKKRIEKFFELVDATLGRGGTVLLPTSIGGRMLELVHLIDDHLQSAPIPVLMLSYTKARNLTYASSMLEWMAPAVIREWETRGQPPFDSSRVQVIEPNELLNMPGAKVVFASGAGFEDGSVAQAALSTLCDDEKTTIILTEKTGENTIGNDLFYTWRSLAQANNGGGKAEDGVPVVLQKQLNVKPIREEDLLGDELAEYENHVKQRRAFKEQAKKSKLSENKETQFEDESESESEDEDILGEEKKVETIPIDVDVRAAKGRAKMFQFVPKKAKYDDYGEIINHSDFTREEEKDVDKMKRHKQNQNNKVQIGEKKKWNEGKKQDDTSDLDALHHPRSRFISQLAINSRCVLTYVDLAGLVDIRSLSLIIPALKPKKVFLSPDSTDNTTNESVLTMFKKHNKFEVIELKPNDPVSAKDSVQSFDILLDEKLAEQLKWQRIAGGFTVAHVIGNIKTKKQIEEEKVKAEPEAEVKDEDVKMEDVESEVKEEETTNDKESSRHDEELVLAPLSQDSTFLANIRSTQLAIGDVKLSELKKSLSIGHKVEFKGEGTLVIDDIVAVRKISDGDVVVDGSPCRLFYEVREAVRKMLAYV